MQLYVPQADWGVAQLNDIEKLLKDVASHLNQLLRNPFEGTIHVIPSEEGFPRVLVRDPQINPFLSLNSPPVIVIGANMLTSSHMSFVMCYPILKN